MRSLRLHILSALLLIGFLSQAQVLVYKGSASCIKTGNGSVTKQKILSYLIIDTTFNDDESGKPNAFLLQYSKNGKTFSIIDAVDLDNDLDEFEIYTITGSKGKAEQVVLMINQDDENSSLYSVTQVKGAVKANQKLYKDENKNTITGTLAKSLKGVEIGVKEGSSENVFVTTDCKHSFKFDSKLTAQCNPNGTAEDFNTAIQVVFNTLGLVPPAP